MNTLSPLFVARIIATISIAAINIAILTSCDSFPVSIHNNTDYTASVSFKSKVKSCNSSKEFIISPDENILLRCNLEDLIEIRSIIDGKSCVITGGDIYKDYGEGYGVIDLNAC